MKREQHYHVLFALALLTLAALGSWWVVFIARAVDIERTAQRQELMHAALAVALTMGHARQAPKLGPVSGPISLEVVSVSEVKKGQVFALAIPRYPKIAVRPRHESLKAIDDKLLRRRIMLFGEASLLFVLLGICTVMLYRLVGQDRRTIRRMEAFVSAVTHEMKTPLTGIKSLLQTFARGGVRNEDKDRLFAMGLKETERLEHLVENILISGRLRGGRYQISSESLSLRPFVENLIEHRKRYLLGKDGSIELLWESARNDLQIKCDPQALRVVLENLLDNAFKYGGQNPVVTLRVQISSECVLLSIEDEGSGFSPDHAEELFIPFRQTLNEKSSSEHGTGLGLSISRVLMRQMHGELLAFSDGPGRGSRFTVSLKEVAK